MKHDNYYSYLLSTLLQHSYLGMILSSCIAKLVSCKFHNLLECSKYALHISTCNFILLRPLLLVSGRISCQNLWSKLLPAFAPSREDVEMMCSVCRAWRVVIPSSQELFQMSWVEMSLIGWVLIWIVFGWVQMCWIN